MLLVLLLLVLGDRGGGWWLHLPRFPAEHGARGVVGVLTRPGGLDEQACSEVPARVALRENPGVLTE